MRWVKSWMLAMVAVLALGAAVLAVDYATRDDAGDTAYQGMGTGGEGAPIQITADAYGRLWVNVGADSTLTAPVAKTLTLVTKEVATSGTGVKLVAAETFARKVVLMAKKAGGANTGLVYIGTSTVDATTPQQIALAPGDTIVIEPGPGCKIDLATIYIDCAAANTDGVTGWYWPI